MTRRLRPFVTTTAIALTLTSCAGGSSFPSDRGSVLHDASVTIGAFDFPESELLARMYAGSLRSAGIHVRILPAAGPRELVQPALQRGLLELVPEYAGTAVQFLSRGSIPPSGDPHRTHRDLLTALAGSRITALAPAAAEDANALVVSRTLARRYKLRSVSDLQPVASRLVFGGPPECPQRPFCLPGLRRIYGLRFGTFVPLDVGGPLTAQALRSGEIQVGLMFTSDPAIEAMGLVQLRDDRGLQPAENVTPLVRTEAIDRFGSRLEHAVDRVTARLTTSSLVRLNAALLAGASPARVAATWLRAEGLS